METFLARYQGIKYSYLVKIKYFKAAEKPGEAKLRKIKLQAGEQLKNYSMDEKLKKNIQGTSLVKMLLVFCGYELIYVGEMT